MNLFLTTKTQQQFAALVADEIADTTLAFVYEDDKRSIIIFG
jgi:hypothetical protein